MTPLISVIIPIYKVEAYLDKCIHSIVVQTYQNLEIILVDDGSPDACPQMCDEWSKKDSRIIVVHKDNEGVGYARNAGLEICSGEYIMFVDPDDYITEIAIESLYNRLFQDDSDMAMGRYLKVYNDDTVGKTPYDWMYDCVIERNDALHQIGKSDKPLFCCVWGKLYRKFIFDDLKFLPLKMSEDFQIFPMIIDRCKKISVSSEIVYFYLQRELSIMHFLSEEKERDRIIATLSATKYLFDLGVTNVAKHYYFASIVYIANSSQKKYKLRKLLKILSKNERKKLKTHSLHMQFYIIGMYFPRIIHLVRAMKKILKK